MTESETFTLNQAARVLGIPRSLVQKAVNAKLLRSTESPFKSNLNPGSLATQVLVVAEDVRKVLAGEISLESIKGIRVPHKHEVPTTDAELGERLVNIQQGVDQVGIMCSAILERLDAAPPSVARPLNPRRPRQENEPHDT
jgi:hypothetical protein